MARNRAMRIGERRERLKPGQGRGHIFQMSSACVGCADARPSSRILRAILPLAIRYIVMSRRAMRLIPSVDVCILAIGRPRVWITFRTAPLYLRKGMSRRESQERLSASARVPSSLRLLVPPKRRLCLLAARLVQGLR